MEASDLPSATSRHAKSRTWIIYTLLFLLLTAGMLVLPRMPATDLDASWRMALGKFLWDGLQFGTQVVFTYGPLGFVMGNTYWGHLLWAMILWQVLQSLVFAAIILWQGRRLSPGGQAVFFGFFLFFGIIYVDALFMLIIALLGFELLRRTDRACRAGIPLISLALALMAIVKFTNLMLAACFIVLAAILALSRRHRGDALRPVAWFLGGYLILWIACWQNPLNLPAYLFSSWQVSSGYETAMGLATPAGQFWEGLAVLGLLIACVVIYWFQQQQRFRNLLFSLGLGALIFLNWKHGFIRADGHIIGFFICALLLVVMFPALMEDEVRWQRWQCWLLLPAGFLCLLGTFAVLPGAVRNAAANLETNVWANIDHGIHWRSYRQTYQAELDLAKAANDLPLTRKTVGKHSIDILGFEQGVALLNGFVYRPRPVFQSYSAYNPYLARLNFDYYASDHAPDYTLLKLQQIDDRMLTMDDSMVLNLLLHRYHYIHSENGYQLWQRNPGPFDPASILPRPLAHAELKPNQSWDISAYAGRPTWFSLTLRPSLLGRLRSFFYKPPMVFLSVEDTEHHTSAYRLPLSEAATGFILNPMVSNIVDFMEFAGGKPSRRVARVTLSMYPSDLKYYQPVAQAELSALQPSTAGLAFFAEKQKKLFHMFKSYPTAYEAYSLPSEELLDGRKVMVMHAPSRMIFKVPAGASQVSGSFGILPSAYTGNNKTDGAEFRIYWRDTGPPQLLFSQLLQPRTLLPDRGLHDFKLALPPSTGDAQLILETAPGPSGINSWDWTSWTAIAIK